MLGAVREVWRGHFGGALSSPNMDGERMAFTRAILDRFSPTQPAPVQQEISDREIEAEIMREFKHDQQPGFLPRPAAHRVCRTLLAKHFKSPTAQDSDQIATLTADRREGFARRDRTIQQLINRVMQLESLLSAIDAKEEAPQVFAQEARDVLRGGK